MLIPFEKWQACKNDFVLIWSEKSDPYLELALKNQCKNLCSKDGSGIGADGILYLSGPSSEVSLRIYNSDGSEAAHCGNGLRCAALAVLSKIQKIQKQLPESVKIHLPLLGKDLVAEFLFKDRVCRN